MTLSEIIQAANSEALDTPLVESCALELGVSIEELVDSVARTIAEDYLNGNISWQFGDTVMNSLHSWAYGPTDFGFSEFSWGVFIAFDEGEYIHKNDPPGFTSDNRTLPLIKKALGVVDA